MARVPHRSPSSRQRAQRKGLGRWRGTWLGRGVACLFLLMLAFCLHAVPVDRCQDHPHDHPPVGHLACADDCACVPLPEAPTPPPADPLPRPTFERLPAPKLITRVPEPEVAPPRS